MPIPIEAGKRYLLGHKSGKSYAYMIPGTEEGGVIKGEIFYDTGGSALFFYTFDGYLGHSKADTGCAIAVYDGPLSPSDRHPPSAPAAPVQIKTELFNILNKGIKNV